jgi:DNA polymerase-3 subunit delta
VGPFFVKSYLQASKTYSFRDVEKILLLLHSYNLKSLGINTARVEDAELLKEMVVKIMM